MVDEEKMIGRKVAVKYRCLLPVKSNRKHRFEMKYARPIVTVVAYMSERERCDVLILGGGLAGLSLAIQLKLSSSELDIVVLEKNPHPVTELTHKVGESTVEVGARYFSEVIGMKKHLDEMHLLKPGLRFFFPSGDNTDITKRTEVGVGEWPRFIAYQIERGRFENALGEEALRLQIDFRTNITVKQTEVSAGDRHHVTAASADGETSFSCRWLVDASGRTGLLRRRLKLAAPVGHHSGAAWFRVRKSVDPSDFSDNPEWRSKASGNLRRNSTNHLMGNGSWVWLIPLAGDDGTDSAGSTSIGIVAENSLHPFDTFNTREKAIEWLKKYEPQVAERVEIDEMADFRTLRRYSHGSTRHFSPDRWGLVGEAGSFHDPFYSVGSDSICVSNTLLTDLIVRDQRGEDISERVEINNEMSIDFFESAIAVFEGNYPMWGNTQVMSSKIYFEYYDYWGFTALLAFNNRLCDTDFLGSVEILESMAALYPRMHEFFRQWHKLDQRPRVQQHVNLIASGGIPLKLHNQLGDDLGEAELRQRLTDNITLTKKVAIALFLQAVRSCLPDQLERVEGRPLNPLGISLDPDKWEMDGLFDASHALEPDPLVIEDCQRIIYDVADAP